MTLEHIVTAFAAACALLLVFVVLLPLWMDADGRRHDEDGR